MSHRIVFIDSHVAGYQSLIAQLPENTEAVLLDAERDGVEQILSALLQTKPNQTKPNQTKLFSTLQLTLSRTARPAPSRSVRVS